MPRAAAAPLNARDIARARESLGRRRDPADAPDCLVGLDGFVDSIIDAVDKRRAPGPDGYIRMANLTEFSARVNHAAGKSANIELVVKDSRAGGNGPILAGALARLGAAVHLYGAIDHPAFDDLRANCASSVSLGEPGATDAIEFDDGKLMLGKTAQMERISWDRLIDAAGGADALRRRCDAARLIAPCDWTMIPAMTDIWRRFATDILPNLNDPGGKAFFVDWSDPAKRTDDEIRAAFDALRAVNAITPVTLGCNLAEAERFTSCLPDHPAADPDDPDDWHGCILSTANYADILGRRTGLHRIAVHSRYDAAIAVQRPCVYANTPHTPTPAATTGAGDHFNAGLCYALLDGLDEPAALATAIAVSGSFVRTGKHPTRDDAVALLDQIPVFDR